MTFPSPLGRSNDNISTDRSVRYFSPQLNGYPFLCSSAITKCIPHNKAMPRSVDNATTSPQAMMGAESLTRPSAADFLLPAVLVEVDVLVPVAATEDPEAKATEAGPEFWEPLPERPGPFPAPFLRYVAASEGNTGSLEPVVTFQLLSCIGQMAGEPLGLYPPFAVGLGVLDRAEAKVSKSFCSSTLLPLTSTRP